MARPASCGFTKGEWLEKRSCLASLPHEVLCHVPSAKKREGPKDIGQIIEANFRIAHVSSFSNRQVNDIPSALWYHDHLGVTDLVCVTDYSSTTRIC